ncbi:hypothetical protein CHS0354_021837 [Potamilus streckersoni]|uniref:Fucosyltransferase N-terminal domain-containing protein n=1 Tax=Potamilus streckersoni TaxID=2493646 RepID=A0AAE0RQI8_9BIVA|nr:hypothetical protein CHS0354_021837 [Potamilus streckersoni]
MVPLPKYRIPSQVWIVANMEPLGNLWGNFDIFNGIFNWTMTYRGDSTLFLPYGHVGKLLSKENGHNKTANYYRQKSKTAAIRISNCNDYARRYQLQIPIVNWKHVNIKLVIPNSYINAYDFPDIESFGHFLELVNNNETMYNNIRHPPTAYHASSVVRSMRKLERHKSTKTLQSLQRVFAPQRVHNGKNSSLHTTLM